jgi:hypothetical protein
MIYRFSFIFIQLFIIIFCSLNMIIRFYYVRHSSNIRYKLFNLLKAILSLYVISLATTTNSILLLLVLLLFTEGLIILNNF